MPSLLPEKPLVISPSLATTLGLEEAVLLAGISECLAHQRPEPHHGLQWLRLGETQLNALFPFWTDRDLQRVAKNLSDKGVILLDGAPYTQSRELCLAMNEGRPSRPVPSPARPSERPARRSSGQANLLARHWQPSDDVIAQLGMSGVPGDFALQQLPEFTLYWGERQEAHHAWSAKFVQHVMKAWRRHQADEASRQGVQPMTTEWQPHIDAVEILERAGIARDFVEDAVPEFVLYWSERGELSKTWNSRFIQHVKKQWLRFTAALEHDTEPRRIPEQWRPSPDVYDILKLANIERGFADQLLPEFILFWRDSNQLHSSWNTKFLQHVKYHWAKQHQYPVAEGGHAQERRTAATGDRKTTSIIERLTDRSWADGLQ